MTQDELNQYESTLWELKHDGYIDAPALIEKQQAEIYELQAKFKDLLLKYGNLYDERYENIGNYCKHESWKKRSDRMTVQCQKCGLEADELSRTYKVYIDITDEEIEKVFQDETGFTLDCDAKVDEVAMLDFARAILRKAQE